MCFTALLATEEGQNTVGYIVPLFGVLMAIVMISFVISKCVALVRANRDALAAEERRQNAIEEAFDERREERRRRRAEEAALVAQYIQREREAAEREKQAESEKRLAVWGSGPDAALKLMKDAILGHLRPGRVLRVMFMAKPEGYVTYQWEARLDSPEEPRVIGFRDGREIFSQFGFMGTHTDLLIRGERYKLAFRVEQGGRVKEDEEEFFVEIMIPDEEQWARGTQAAPVIEDPLAARLRNIRNMIDYIIQSSKAEWEAIKEVKEILRKNGCDDDESARMLEYVQSQLAESR